MKTPTNVHVDNYTSFNKRASVGWNFDGARYHVWIDVETLAIDGKFSSAGPGTLYKNPPLEVERGEPGHYDARLLDATATKNAALIARVFEIVKRDGLVAKAIAKQNAADQRKRDGYAAAAKVARIKEAGPELLEALRYVVMPTNLPPEQVTPEILEKVLNATENARALIARLDGGKS